MTMTRLIVIYVIHGHLFWLISWIHDSYHDSYHDSHYNSFLIHQDKFTSSSHLHHLIKSQLVFIALRRVPISSMLPQVESCLQEDSKTLWATGHGSKVPGVQHTWPGEAFHCAPKLFGLRNDLRYLIELWDSEIATHPLRLRTSQPLTLASHVQSLHQSARFLDHLDASALCTLHLKKKKNFTSLYNFNIFSAPLRVEVE